MQDPQSLTMLAPDEPLSPAERRRSLVAVIACISVVGMGLGVSIPLLALLMERNGVPASVIGLNTAMPALATFLFTPFIATILRRTSAISFLLACILVSALAMPAYYLFPNVWVWFPIRFVNGLAFTGLFDDTQFCITPRAH
jgi:predicted MFS family arabinose efflux permease